MFDFMNSGMQIPCLSAGINLPLWEVFRDQKGDQKGGGVMNSVRRGRRNRERMKRMMEGREGG